MGAPRGIGHLALNEHPRKHCSQVPGILRISQLPGMPSPQSSTQWNPAQPPQHFPNGNLFTNIPFRKQKGSFLASSTAGRLSMYLAYIPLPYLIYCLHIWHFNLVSTLPNVVYSIHLTLNHDLLFSRYDHPVFNTFTTDAFIIGSNTMPRVFIFLSICEILSN